MSTAVDLSSEEAVEAAVIPGIEVNEMDIAIRHVRAVDGVMALLEGLSIQECRAVLFEVQVRRELAAGTSPSIRSPRKVVSRAAVPKAPKAVKTHMTLEQALKSILSDAPRGGFSSKEVIHRAKGMGLQPASVAAQLSALATQGEVERTGERGAFRYTMQ